MIYSCCNENRKSAVLKSASSNGIDYLEVVDHDAIALSSPRQQTLLVHCLKAVPAALTPDNVLIQGGESITDVEIDWVAPAAAPPVNQTNIKEQKYFTSLADAANVLVVRTNKAGDFARYTLRLVNQASAAIEDPFEITATLAGFDPQLAEVQFSFKVECGPDFDCASQPPDCPPATLAPPPINYLAKDYGSFRTIILDRLNQLLPGWGGTSEADLGVALAELIAYVGDHLSYQQDAVTTEAYLETARSRVSLRRHAMLVDYHVHDGCNARAWVRVQTAGDAGEAVFLDRTLTRFYTFAPGMPSSLAVGSNNEEAALLAGVRVFEPMWDAILYPEHNQMPFYTWGDTNCCLRKGATEATLLGSFPNLQPGAVLIFQEMLGPQTGDSADADIRHRCAVRLTQVTIQNGSGKPLVDPLLLDGNGKSILLTEIQWSSDDALPFPVCVSSAYLDPVGHIQTHTDISIAFGNVVLADHGLSMTNKLLGTVPAPRLYAPLDPAADRCSILSATPLAVRFRPQIPDSPVTQAVPVSPVSLGIGGNPVTSAVVTLSGTGLVKLTNASGFTSLSLRATNSDVWPSLFGVVVVANLANSANFDLSVVYNPPGGAAGFLKQIVVEKFTNLSLKPADPNFVVTQINTHSRLIHVPAAYVAPAAPPSGFPAAPTMLVSGGAVNLQDLSNPAVTYLMLEPTDTAGWPAAIGVTAQASANPIKFDLRVVYDPPSGGVGVALPVAIEQFLDLSVATAASTINSGSQLIGVVGYAQTSDSSLSAYDLMNFDPDQAIPAISLAGTLNARAETWSALHDLLESGESEPVFVVEVESDGTATLRFGDDVNGRMPDTGTSFVANYRIGNGTSGNVGPDSLAFLAAADARIQSCSNPLSAVGGTEPETNDQIRRRAPQAFVTQERAVTPADYEAVAKLNPQVDRAVASLRWTGSWYTVFIAAEPQGGGNLTKALKQNLTRTINRYRLAGQDLELDSPEYISLEIELSICVDPNYFQSDVKRSLLAVLGNQVLPNGQKGLFFPDSFTFGQTVYLSPVYAAARSVAGVASVTATRFQPQGVNTGEYLAAGRIKLGSLQVARLENDPNFPDHGQLTLSMEGGK